MVWYGMVWYGMVWFGLIWFDLVWSCLVLSCLVLSCLVLFCLVLLLLFFFNKNHSVSVAELVTRTATLTRKNSKDFGLIFLNAVCFRRGLTCTLGLTNDLIDGRQPTAKPRLRKVKPNYLLKTVFIPRLATVYQVVG